MKKAIVFIGSLLSILSYSNEMSNVDILLKNSERLDFEILNVEKNSTSEISIPDKKLIEKLKSNLVELKRYRIDLQKENSLNEAIQVANKYQWTNTSVFFSRIKSICSSAKKIENECFIALSQTKEFLKNRKMPESNKVSFERLINDYSKFKESSLVVNDQFINQTNVLLNEVKKLYLNSSKPLAVIKLVSTKNGNYSSLDEKTKVLNFLEYEKLLSLIRWIIIGGLASGIVTILVFWKKKKNRIKRFYMDVFYITKRQRIPTRFYGKVKLSKVSKLKRVDNLYLNLLNSSGSLKSNLDIRLKNRGERLLLETVVYSNVPIQEFWKKDSLGKFSQELENAEKEMISLGGELHLTNSFDDQGKFISSSFIIVI